MLFPSFVMERKKKKERREHMNKKQRKKERERVTLTDQFACNRQGGGGVNLEK